MKRILMTGIILIVICLSVGAASAEGLFDFFGSDESNAKLENNTFIVGFNSQFPPFGYDGGNGEFKGFDIDLAKEVCKRNNWTLKLQPIIDWNTKQMELESGEIDCIWSEFTINGREDNYTWSQPYFNNTMVAAVKKDSNITSLDDLNGKTVEVQQGSSVLKTINENESLKSKFKSITEVGSYDTAFMDLESGVCDVIILDSGLANYFVVEKYPDLLILNDSISDEQYGVGFKKGNDAVRDQVQKTLDEMFKDGTVEKIAQNYSEYKIPEGLIFPK